MSAHPVDDSIRELARLQAINTELVAALKLIVEHFGDPLKVARAAIQKAEQS
jgi:hypothetical protein